MAVMIHPFGPKPHPLAEIIPINCTGCGICGPATRVLGGPCILERQRAAAASGTGSGIDPVGA